MNFKSGRIPKWLLDHGIMPGGALFRSAPGTIFEGMPSPRTEYFLRILQARSKLLADYPWARRASAG